MYIHMYTYIYIYIYIQIYISGNSEIVGLLLDKGADKDKENDMGDTAATLAQAMGTDDVKKLMQ